MSGPDDRRLDDKAGPTTAGEGLDVLAMVCASTRPAGDPASLGPRDAQILRSCQAPVSVADLASGLDLPLSHIRNVLADLRERGLVQVRQPARNWLTDPRILQQVADGLRQLLPPLAGQATYAR